MCEAYLFLFKLFYCLLTQSLNHAIHDIDLSGLRLFREPRDTHDLAHDDNDHLGSVIDDYISYF